jgi:hypothetical protein
MYITVYYFEYTENRNAIVISYLITILAKINKHVNKMKHLAKKGKHFSNELNFFLSEGFSLVFTTAAQILGILCTGF